MECTQQTLLQIIDVIVKQRDALEQVPLAANLMVPHVRGHLMGEKERNLGALRQHEQEHGC